MGSFGENGDNAPIEEKTVLGDLPEEERLGAALKTYGKALSSLADEEGWLSPVMFSLILGSLHTLRNGLEDPEDESVSWADPWIEVQYPVPWDPEEWKPAFHVFTPKDGTEDEVFLLTPEVLESEKETLDALVKMVQQSAEIFALITVTNEVIITTEKDKTSLSFFPWSEHHEEFQELDEEERRSRGEELSAPFILGGTCKTSDDSEEDPKLSFLGETDSGETFRGLVVFQVFPITVDLEEERAYYSIAAGLVFEEGDPSSWTAEERKNFWDPLFDAIQKDGIHNLQDEEEDIPPPSSESIIPAGIGVPFGPAMVSASAYEMVKHSHKVRLPSRWSTLPRWDKLVEKEIETIQSTEGDRAFVNLREETGDPDQRGKLLKHRRIPGGGTEPELTAEAERRLKRRIGLGKGFIEVGKFGHEYLVKTFQVGDGFLEVGLSWHGLAGPLVDEWMDRLKVEAKERLEDLKEPLLFDDLDEKRRRAVDRMLQRVTVWEDGRRIMEMVLGQVGRQGRNIVEIPAEALRVLLWPEEAKTRTWPKGWKERVDNAFRSLVSLTFKYETHKTTGAKGGGAFIGEWKYIPLGSGRHGEGVYRLNVMSGFLGCLDAFESGKTRLRSGGDALLYDFRKKVKGDLGGDHFITFDAGRPFYNAAAGLTPNQENVLNFVERELTLKGDTVRRGRNETKARRGTTEGREFRRYTSNFCPLLPEGGTFLGACGHFTRNPESGRTLTGTGSRPARTSSGIIAEAGYRLPPGVAVVPRREIVRKTLEDLKAVVVDYLGGVVAGLLGDEWIPLERFGNLEEKDLCKKLRIFPFIPEDYGEKRRSKWEEATGRKATEDIRKASDAAWGGRLGEDTVLLPDPSMYRPEDPEDVEEDQDLREPVSVGDFEVDYLDDLNVKFRDTITLRGIKKGDAAGIFGVSVPSISYWTRSLVPDPDFQTGVGKRIPEAMVPLIVRWIETGEGPSDEELETFKARRDRERSKARKRIQKDGKN